MSAPSEYGVIGAILFDESGFLAAMDCGLRPEWFTDGSALLVYEWTRARFAEGKPADLLSCAAAGHKFPWIEHAYEHARLSAIPAYVADMRNTWLKAQALIIHGQTVEALNSATEPTEIIIQASERLRRLMDIELGDNMPLSAIAQEHLDDWNTSPNNTGKGVSWPLSQLESGIGNLTGELVYIVAAPSVGKTAFVLQWLLSLAWAGHTVALRSLESPKRQLVARLMASIGRINTWRLRKGRGLPADFAGAEKAIVSLKEIEKRIHISDAPAGIEQLNAWAQIEKAKGAEVLMIDNMKHIRPDAGRRYSSPVEQFRDVSQRLKWLRDDVALPVVVLHHTNKEGAASWSSDIERDVDTLIMMVEDESKTVKADPDNGWCGRTTVEFQVRKQRDGARGFKIMAEFDGATQTFESRADDGLEAERG